METKMQIFNYNLLSTDLARPDYHNKCNPFDLDTTNRWKLIQLKLIIQTKRNAIICLQELSSKWIELLLPFFMTKNYYFIYDSQWLGVGIAFPQQIYGLEDLHFVPIGDKIKQNCQLIPQLQPTIWKKLSSYFYYLPTLCSSTTKKQTEDIWQMAINRRNRLLGIKLKINNNIFYVFTYHMPCAFKTPDLMNIHCLFLLKAIDDIAIKDQSFILAGDFNSMQQSDVYKLITQGIHPVLPDSSLYTILKDINTGKLLQSAYVAYNGTNPFFTNFSHTKDATEPFMACIDYIFFSPNLKCINTFDTLHEVPMTTFPNQFQPSDHLPIGATFRFLS